MTDFLRCIVCGAVEYPPNPNWVPISAPKYCKGDGVIPPHTHTTVAAIGSIPERLHRLLKNEEQKMWEKLLGVTQSTKTDGKKPFVVNTQIKDVQIDYIPVLMPKDAVWVGYGKPGSPGGVWVTNVGAGETEAAGEIL